jgi:sulfite exporter TauE/SafE/protein-disulfide isomerase
MNDIQTNTAKNSVRDYAEIGAAFLIVIGILFALGQFDLLPRQFGLSNAMSYGLIFVIGLVASVSSCIAVTGGLLVAVAAQYNETTANLTPMRRMKPLIYFNVGRVLSYTLLGGAIGALGSALTLSPGINGALSIIASVVMVLLGLQMLKLLPGLTRFLPTMPKAFGHYIHDLAERDANGGAFVLGAITFFLPCGFTQALQLYVLAKGSFTVGALTMLAFVLGTLPALVSLSALSSFATGGFQRHFLKFAGATVVILGLFNIQNGLTLTATAAGPTAAVTASSQTTSAPAVQTVPIVDGKQIVDMKIVGYQYQPHTFNVMQGIPVEWRVDATEAEGCGRILMAPGAGVRKLLSAGTNLISFTPQQAGDIRFNCAMGMMTPGSKITVLPSAQKNESAVAPPVQRAAATPPTQTADAPQSAFSPAQSALIEQMTKDYILAHPEVIQDALTALQNQREVDEAKALQTTVKEHDAEIFESPHQVVLGNPHGKVTLVEFFDYNCAYCKRALSDMLSLIKDNSELRVVLKEFPVLGDGSMDAARVAVAVRMQDPTGQKYLDFHQQLLGGKGEANGERALAVAKDVGLDVDRLKRDMASPEVKATIDENLKLGETIGITGTPTYVVGSEVVVGAVGLDELAKKLAAARGKTNG